MNFVQRQTTTSFHACLAAVGTTCGQRKPCWNTLKAGSLFAMILQLTVRFESCVFFIVSDTRSRIVNQRLVIAAKSLDLIGLFDRFPIPGPVRTLNNQPYRLLVSSSTVWFETSFAS